MDRYRVEKVVGKGSFGQAILCARVADGKACIVKQVDTSQLPSKARREARREATLLARLSHPNIVGFWESFLHGRSQDILCIVMDYADGGDLSSCLKRRGGRLLDEEVVLDWFVQTTLALKHIHDRKILHRDLKTQNIFLTRSRVVKLGDFGIAKVLGNTFDLAKTAIGTPYYMSPEICQEKRYNHKSDMWSLGCVLYEMACLRHAFEASDMRLLVMKICAHEPRPISARYSMGVRSLVSHLLKKDPHARPSTGAVLRRPLIKDKIGRFLSDTQIKEEFSKGASSGQQPGSSSSAARPGVAAVVSKPPSGKEGGAAPRWPFQAAGVSRPRQGAAAASPERMGWAQDGRYKSDRIRNRNMNKNKGEDDDDDVGRAIFGGDVGRAAQEGRARDRRRRAAEDTEERRRADALARKKEARMAKQRGQLAAVALNVAKAPSPGGQSAKPKRADLGKDAAGVRQRGVRRAERGALDLRRARERAELACVALGVGGKSPSLPRRASQYDGGKAKIQAPRRPSDEAVSPVRADLRAHGGGGGGGEGDGRRGGEGGGDCDVGGSLRRSKEEKSLEKRKGAGGANLGVEMDVALELVRRRRAARAVFGLEYGSQDNGEPEGNSPVQVEETGSGGLEAKSSSPDGPVRSKLDAASSCSSSGRASAEPAVSTPPRGSSVEPGERPTPSETKDGTQQQRNNSNSSSSRSSSDHGATGTAALPGEDAGGGRERKVESFGAEVEDVAADGGGWAGDANQSHDAPAAVAKTPWMPTEQKESIDYDYDDGDRWKGTALGRGRVGVDVSGAHKEGKAEEGSRDEATTEAGEQREEDSPTGSGCREMRGKVDLGVENGWFEKLEAKMGAIKQQMGRIKSPPLSTPQRNASRPMDHASSSMNSRRDKIEATPSIYETPPPPSTSKRDVERRDHHHHHHHHHHHSPGAVMIDNADEKVDWSIGDGSPAIHPGQNLAVVAADQQKEVPYPGEGGGDETKCSGTIESCAVAAAGAPIAAAIGSSGSRSRRGDDDSRSAALRRCNSQKMARISAAEAAVEAAAAAVAGIPANIIINISENNTPDVGRGSSDSNLLGQDRPRNPCACQDGEDHGRDGNPVEDAGGRSSESARARARARALPRGGMGGVKVLMTPAQRGGGGRGRASRRPPLSSKSERKPPRHAAALVAELERHSERRPSRRRPGDVRTPEIDDHKEGEGGENAPALSVEERVQALRATRDRERGHLRALIAQRRRKSNENMKREGGVGGDREGGGRVCGASGESSPEGVVGAEPSEVFQQAWSSPRDLAAAGGRASSVATPAASDTPRRREGRARDAQPQRKPVAIAGKKAGLVGGRGSSDAPRRRRRPRGNGGGGKHGSESNGNGELDAARGGVVGGLRRADRDPAKRHQNLRDFIAESRRKQRARRQSDGLGGDDDDISVVMIPIGEGGGEGEERGGSSFDLGSPPAAVAAAAELEEEEEEEEEEGLVADTDQPITTSVVSDAEEEAGEDAVVAMKTRRNLGFELDEEDRAQEGIAEAGRDGDGVVGGGVESSRQGSLRNEEWGRGRAERIVALGPGKESAEEGQDDEHVVVGSGGSNPSPGSPSSSSQQGSCQECPPSAEAEGAMEGAKPGLATYDYHRSAARKDGGGHAGQEEYARMLELMKQEVLELGDDASTDSGWGGTSSSSGEGTSTSRLEGRKLDSFDADGQSTISGGGGGAGGRFDDFEAKGDESPSPALRVQEEKEAAQSSPRLPPSINGEGAALFEYSRTGCLGLSAKALSGGGGAPVAPETTLSEGRPEVGVDGVERGDAGSGMRLFSRSGTLRGLGLAGGAFDHSEVRGAHDSRDDDRSIT